MNRRASPSPVLRTPSPPLALGERDGVRGCGSWRVSTVPGWRIGATNSSRSRLDQHMPLGPLPTRAKPCQRGLGGIGPALLAIQENHEIELLLGRSTLRVELLRDFIGGSDFAAQH